MSDAGQGQESQFTRVPALDSSQDLKLLKLQELKQTNFLALSNLMGSGILHTKPADEVASKTHGGMTPQLGAEIEISSKSDILAMINQTSGDAQKRSVGNERRGEGVEEMPNPEDQHTRLLPTFSDVEPEIPRDPLPAEL